VDLRCFSFCCGRDGCRGRLKPPSIRFLDRRVYLGVWVVLMAAFTSGLNEQRRRRLWVELGVDERTVSRWRHWWRVLLPASARWRSARADLMPPPAESDLPQSLLSCFDLPTRSRDGPGAAVDALRLLAQHRARRRCPYLGSGGLLASLPAGEPTGNDGARMTANDPDMSDHVRWALFRHSVVGHLLAAPPKRGNLRSELAKLTTRQWQHPISEAPVAFSFSTIERWYYAARNAAKDPVGALRKRTRSDLGRQHAFPAKLREQLLAQYKAHRSWSYQLHHDNLAALVKAGPDLGPQPSYATVRRFMKANGLIKLKRRKRKSAAADEAQNRLDAREVRSYEVEHVGGLWHFDFHEGSLPILTPRGEWVKPWLFGCIDDHSRLMCHAQWYLTENAENCVHSLTQAILKRGLPRASLSDNGGAETAAETIQGMKRLGIEHETTLPHSPYQNAKQEVWWGQVEGRLLKMLESVEELTLELLNRATLAWVEEEYNRATHDEIDGTPLERFLSAPNVMRPAASLEDLRIAFGQQVRRTQRRGDGTISIEGKRLEVPTRYRHLEHITVRYARWDLGHVHMIDRTTDQMICRLFPLDKAKNADGRRRLLDAVNPLFDQEPSAPGIAPLLQQLMADYAATGLPPAYIPKDEFSDPNPDEEEISS
jgi:transposase InsO family protein